MACLNPQNPINFVLNVKNIAPHHVTWNQSSGKKHCKQHIEAKDLLAGESRYSKGVSQHRCDDHAYNGSNQGYKNCDEI